MTARAFRLPKSHGKGVTVSKSQKKPEIVVFAGPNGSGKSTLTELLMPPMDYINADEIKKNLKCSDLEAAQIAERQRESYLERRESFCFETVMSTERNLNLLRRAKESGYFIRCYYVVTSDPLINVYRIRARVQLGGHDVPVEKIYARYDRAMALAKNVVAVSDVCHIYDNSAEVTFRIFKKRKKEYFYDECEDWQLSDIQELTGVHDAEKKSLNVRRATSSHAKN